MEKDVFEMSITELRGQDMGVLLRMVDTLDTDIDGVKQRYLKAASYETRGLENILKNVHIAMRLKSMEVGR